MDWAEWVQLPRKGDMVKMKPVCEGLPQTDEDNIVCIVRKLAQSGSAKVCPKITVPWPDGQERGSCWANEYVVVCRVHERN
jgi:hypothetical protein